MKYKIDVDEYYMIWFKNDKYHREYGPSVVDRDQVRKWYKNNLTHRLDGPAVEWKDGSKFWFINGQSYTKTEFFQISPEDYTI